MMAIKKGDICKMTVDYQYDYRKVAYKDITVFVLSVEDDLALVEHDNDVFACPIDWIEKTGTTNLDLQAQDEQEGIE